MGLQKQIFDLMDEKDAIELLKELISFDTVNPPGNEKKLAAFIHQRLQHAGIDASIIDIEDGRANVMTSIDHQGAKHLVFSGHLDTVPIGQVPWEVEPLAATIQDDKLYGRGSTDMKSGVAAMIIALECIERANVQLNGKLTFVGTAGEEVNGLGAKEIIDNRRISDATAIVIGEPTRNQICFAHKGTLWLQITFKGKTAHGSMPEQGASAILAANHFINEINEYKVQGESHQDLGDSTVNIGTIKGGTSTNVVPDFCKVSVDIRTVVGQSHSTIVHDIESILKKVCQGTEIQSNILVVNDMPAVATPKHDPFIEQSLTTAEVIFGNTHTPQIVNYYTDASVFCQSLDVPVLIYGPGEPLMAHKPNEYVEIDQYLKSINYYIALALNYLG